MTDTKSNGGAAQGAPHCLHVVGIGRSGAGYVDGLLRTGEIEDILSTEGARLAALVVDVGDDDLARVKGYAQALRERMAERGIPADRFQFQAVSLEVPARDELIASLGRLPKLVGSKDSGFESWLPADIELPEAGAHLPRAVAKAIYARAYYDGDRPLDGALSAFAEHVAGTKMPSRVMVCFHLAGGTGSGMAVDLARHLANDKLGGDIPVIGVGQLPHSGDGEAPASLFASLNEIDCMSDDHKNAGVTKGRGEGYGNPFTGGFFVVNTEHSWQRLTAYTKTGQPAVRDRIRQEVTNKFAQDSFMRFAVRDTDGALSRALRAAGLEGAAGETASGKPRSWMLFNLAKFTHPGVQVLPGEPLSKWRRVIDQWIDHLDDFSGLKKDFRTNHAEIHVHAPRQIGFDRLDAKLKKKMAESFLAPGEDANVEIANHEFFDYLTSYADIVLPKLARTDLDAFWAARAAYDGLDEAQRKLCHSWLLERGVVVSATKQAAA
jgi:hypothetical protein